MTTEHPLVGTEVAYRSPDVYWPCELGPEYGVIMSVDVETQTLQVRFGPEGTAPVPTHTAFLTDLDGGPIVL